MIARIWHGTVTSEKAKEYCEIIERRYIPDIRAYSGNEGIEVLVRSEGVLTHFLITSYWRDMESIRRFAGEDVEVARYYPEDRDYLIEFETHVIHYEVYIRQ